MADARINGAGWSVIIVHVLCGITLFTTGGYGPLAPWAFFGYLLSFIMMFPFFALWGVTYTPRGRV